MRAPDKTPDKTAEIKSLRILIVEDDENDAALVLRHLRKNGYDIQFERVDTGVHMAEALSRPWDLVLSDFSMPTFSAPDALAILKERQIDIPFIIISGTIDDEMAVDAMRAGAQDFLVKGKFARLIPAIEREMREAAMRAQQRNMQEQLLITDRMASVGTLAAGVAHEINNPLAALVANLDVVALSIAALLKDGRSPAEKAKGGGATSAEKFDTGLRDIEEPLRDAREAADRVRQIVKDVKIFSRADASESRPIDVHRIMDSSLRIAWNEIRNRARLTKNYGAIPMVQANESRLGQVFLNMIVNAAQAITEGNPAGNEIRITTSPVDDGRVVVEVRDTGTGMSEAVRSKIFDTFFTTKPAGVGTGLGLSICHRLISEMGGAISVESEEGKGSLFRIFLPAAKSDRVMADTVTPAPRPARRGRILVVDDEAMLGTVIRRMLIGEHDVTTVTSARDALDRMTRGERYDVIFSDLMMPVMTGMDLYTALNQLAPDQAERIVFMSGGAFTAVVRDFLGGVANPRINKPFDVGTLRALVYNLTR